MKTTDDEDDGRLPADAPRATVSKKENDRGERSISPSRRPAFTEATIIKRMEELGIGRPSTYDATIQTLKAREYVKLDKKRLLPEDKGRLVIAFLESFFARYVGYDFTADLEEKLDRISNHEIDWKAGAPRFLDRLLERRSRAPRICARPKCSTISTRCWGRISSRSARTAVSPRQCQVCGTGQLSLKLGKFGAFVGCSNYPECKFTRQLNQTGESRRG